MNITDLIAQLSELQLEQNKILAQIAARTESTKAEPKDTIHIGDHVLLLTGGIRCIKGDKARVTKVPTIRYLSRKGVIMMFSFSCCWCFADRRDRNIPTVKAFKKSRKLI